MGIARPIRFPDDLVQAITAEAERDHRKFSDEVRHLCRLALDKIAREREEGAA